MNKMVIANPARILKITHGLNSSFKDKVQNKLDLSSVKLNESNLNSTSESLTRLVTPLHGRLT
ncbi:hypothetical protein HanIR_Chr11g0541491 [Helianthus annuus]|nr:hypothetical protein HanIR_Chr11g0541491 [Helianthus annuus]